MVRAAQRFGAERLAAIERALGGVDAGGADLGVGRNRIVGLGANRDGGPLEAEVVEPLAPVAVELFVGAEDRHFDAVVADFLELLEDRQHAVVQVIGPQQEVHAEFHGSHLQLKPPDGRQDTPRILTELGVLGDSGGYLR